MGEVYKALHVHLHALRVIKLMRPNIAGEREAHDRFLREARLANRIQHPNVAALFDFSGLPDGSFYMVWEYIEGTNLRKFVHDRRFLRPDVAVRLASQALMGLDAIHRAGIIHRDISPENLMVASDELGRERIKIIDLGVAKQWNETNDEQTRTGIFVGKFKYCSPEQLGMLKRGERIDGRADIYSFALVLYEMLTGIAPFQAETPHQYLVLQTGEMPRPLRTANPQTAVPPQLEALLFRALAKDRERRFNTAAEFAQALEATLPALPESGPTVAVALPHAQSVADVTVAPVTPTVVRPEPLPKSASLRTPGPGMSDSAIGRKRDLFDQVVKAIGDEQYAKGDAALQNLRMHLGARAESDTEFRRLRNELERGAADKEAWFLDALERAREEAKPKEVQSLLAERDERLGRRFGPASVRFENEVWLRRRDELFTKGRSWITAESFVSAGGVLEELAEHLGAGAAVDEEYLALRQIFQQALADASEKMRQEIVAAHAQENIGKTRRLLSMYDAKFGQEVSKHASITAAEAWVREMDGLRKTLPPARQTTEVRRVTRRRRGGLVITLIVVTLVAGAVAAACVWKPRTAQLVQRYTSGRTRSTLLDFLGVAPLRAVPPVPHPPRIEASKASLEGQPWTNPTDGLEYVWIPAGTADLGCVDGDTQCAPDEPPRHAVSAGGFWLAKTEVTVEVFERFVRATGRPFILSHARPPIDDVVSIGTGNWRAPLLPNEQALPKWPVGWLTASDAAAFCAWGGGRLPTEDEWEYAARGADAATIHGWGNAASPPSAVANLADAELIRRFAVPRRLRHELFPDYTDHFDTYAPVASFTPNRFGLFDLEGNVWEWCAAGGGARVLRGGSWGSVARDVRLSARKVVPPGQSSWGTGCRCAIAATVSSGR
jgi:serine/threonine-protein kinase